MNPSGPGMTLCIRSSRAVEPDRGPKRAAGHFERADKRRQDRACPAALIAAPAIVDGLAQGDRHRAEWQGQAVDIYGLADARIADEIIGNPADRGGRHIADARGPFRRERCHMFDETRYGRFWPYTPDAARFAVRPDLNAAHLEAAFQLRGAIAVIERHRTSPRAVPNQGQFGSGSLR